MLLFHPDWKQNSFATCFWILEFGRSCWKERNPPQPSAEIPKSTAYVIVIYNTMPKYHVPHSHYHTKSPFNSGSE